MLAEYFYAYNCQSHNNLIFFNVNNDDAGSARALLAGGAFSSLSVKFEASISSNSRVFSTHPISLLVLFLIISDYYEILLLAFR